MVMTTVKDLHVAQPPKGRPALCKKCNQSTSLAKEVPLAKSPGGTQWVIAFGSCSRASKTVPEGRTLGALQAEGISVFSSLTTGSVCFEDGASLA